MGLHYSSIQKAVLIGSKTEAGVRTGVTLESTYQAEASTVATKTVEVGGYSKLTLDILYTMGAAETSNTIEIKVETSPDRVNFYRMSTNSSNTLTATEYTFAGTNGAAATISLTLDTPYDYVRISVKESGVASNKGTLFVEGTLAGK